MYVCMCVHAAVKLGFTVCLDGGMARAKARARDNEGFVSAEKKTTA